MKTELKNSAGKPEEEAAALLYERFHCQSCPRQSYQTRLLPKISLRRLCWRVGRPLQRALEKPTSVALATEVVTVPRRLTLLATSTSSSGDEDELSFEKRCKFGWTAG